MGEFAPVTALGGAAVPIRANAEPTATTVTPVATSASGQGAEARMDTASRSPRPVARGTGDNAVTGDDNSKPKLDEFTLVGPTPAFQANVLELERDLQRAIERLEGERGRVEAEAAMKIQKAEARAEEADQARADTEQAPALAADADAPTDTATAPQAETPEAATAADEG